MVEVFNLRDLVLLEENHLELGLVLQARDLGDAVALQPDAL